MFWAVVITSCLTLALIIRHLMTSSREKSTTLQSTSWSYNKMKQLIHEHNIRLPAMFVNMDIFDSNAKHIIDIVRGSGKTLRIATKSIRSVDLIKCLETLGQGVIVSFMCYSIEEARLLSEHGFNDFYIPYPTMQQCDIVLALDLTEKGKVITLTVDCVSHIERLDALCDQYHRNKVAPGNCKLRVAADLDLSFKLFDGLVQLGAHRSQMDSVEKFAAVARAAANSKHVKLVGAMGYEAHVAGLPDTNPHDCMPNLLVQLFKKHFLRQSLDFRMDIAKYCKANGIELAFFNGGGSGNIREACADGAITEVTAGSAFLQSQIFDYFAKNECSAAFCFALQATRVNRDYICCQSGGFIASGGCSQDKFPKPFANPVELCHYTDEGYGEVQTPLQIKRPTYMEGNIGIGDPVFFRPAKAGEIGEHFHSYYLLRDYQVVGQAKTYRGLGHVFY